MMITLLEKYETQCKLLKVRLYPCWIPTVSIRIGGGGQYGSKDAYNIDKLSWEGKHCRQEEHIK
jgi:hypothetical protein